MAAGRRSRDGSRKARIAEPWSLPGELQPFLIVSCTRECPGYVEKVLADRGSVVKEGQFLVELSAPEMAARNRGGGIQSTVR